MTIKKEVETKHEHVDNLCNRLFRSTQDRKNRMDMINHIFRKCGRRKYRFSESRLRKRISDIFGYSEASPNKSGNADDEESSQLERHNTISPKKTKKIKSLKKAGETINLGESPRSPAKTLRLGKLNKNRINITGESARFANTSYNGFDIGGKILKKHKLYGYDNYTLGSKYHIVKNPKNYSVDYKGHFEIVPNEVKTEEHVQTVDFCRFPNRNLMKPMKNYQVSSQRKSHYAGFNIRLSRLSKKPKGRNLQLSVYREINIKRNVVYINDHLNPISDAKTHSKCEDE